MGFMDKMKGTAKQAMSPGGQMAERDKITKINQSGIEARATVDSMQETGTQLGGGHQIDFQLTVHPADGGADYQVRWRRGLYRDCRRSGASGKLIRRMRRFPRQPRVLVSHRMRHTQPIYRRCIQ